MKLTKLISALLAVSLFTPAVAFAEADENYEDAEALEQYLQQQQEQENKDENHTAETPKPTAAPAAQKKASVSEDVYLLVSSLGFMSRAEIDMTGTVSRAYMAEVLARMSGLDRSKAPTGSIYTDVNENTQYGYSIELMTDCGYFNGTDNNMFLPEDGATDNQMYTVLMRFAGYTNFPGWESSYSEVYKNAGGGEELTYPDMANMIYNMLNMKAVNISVGNNVQYSKDNKKSVLNSVYDIDKVSGTVSKNGRTALYSDSGINPDEVQVDSSNGYLIIRYGETDIEKALGKYVNVYYRYDKEEDANICVGYSVPDTKNNIREVSLDDIAYDTITEREIRYDDAAGREQKLKYTAQTAVIYNGTYFSDADFSVARLREMEGSITFIDNDKDSTYDVMVIEAYNVYQVKSVVLSSQTIYFKESKSAGDDIIPRDSFIELNDGIYDHIELTDSSGIICYLEDFDADTIVSVAKNCESASDRYIKVIVSYASVDGMVRRVDNSGDGRTEVELDDGKIYKAMQMTENLPSASQNVKLLLTAFGHVAGVSYISNGGFYYGIVYKLSYKDHDNETVIKMLTSSNSIEEFSIKDTVKIDGKAVKDPETACDILRSVTYRDAGQILPQGKYPIRYRLGETGGIIELDTPTLGYSESENSLTLMGKLSNATMLNYVFGLTVPVESSTPIFFITNEYSGIDDWGSATWDDTSYSTVSTVGNYVKSFLQNPRTLAAFKVNKDQDKADLIVMVKGAPRQSNGTTMFMLDKKTESYDPQSGETAYRLKGLLGGVETEIITAPKMADNTTIAEMRQGDVIQYETDSYGRICNARFLVRNGDDGMKAFGRLADTEDTTTGFDSLKPDAKGKIDAGIVYGYVLKREGDLIKIRNIEPDKRAESFRDYNRNIYDSVPNEEGWLRIPGSTPVMVYDPSKKFPVYAGTYDEIRDDGAKRSIVGLRYQSSTILREIIVYNDGE